MYKETKVYLSDGQKAKVRSAYKNEQECTLRIKTDQKPNFSFKLTDTQIKRIAKGQEIKLSKTQLKQNGGFIGALLPLLAKGALAGLASLGAQRVAKKVLTGKGKTKKKGRGVLQNWE